MKITIDPVDATRAELLRERIGARSVTEAIRLVLMLDRSELAALIARTNKRRAKYTSKGQRR